MVLYVQQVSLIYLKIFELLNSFRTRILLWFELQCPTIKIISEIHRWRLKIKAGYYKQEILSAYLLPQVDRLYPKRTGCFSVRFCTVTLIQNCLKFIKQKARPSFSLDLNLLDYCIWGILESKINVKQHKNLVSLKGFLLLEQDKLITS